jgi:hypothetical protein
VAPSPPADSAVFLEPSGTNLKWLGQVFVPTSFQGSPSAGAVSADPSLVNDFVVCPWPRCADDIQATKDWYSRLLGVDPYLLNPTEGRPAYVELRIGDYQHELGIIDCRFSPHHPSSCWSGSAPLSTSRSPRAEPVDLSPPPSLTLSATSSASRTSRTTLTS